MDKKTTCLIEVPIEWMTSKIDREARQSTAFFTQLVTAAIALGCRVETSPALMYSDGAPIFSKNADLTIAYHTYGDTLGVWHSKESYLPGYFTIDRRGYSGASELAQNPEIFADDIAIVIKNKLMRIAQPSSEDLKIRTIRIAS